MKQKTLFGKVPQKEKAPPQNTDLVRVRKVKIKHSPKAQGQMFYLSECGFFMRLVGHTSRPERKDGGLFLEKRVMSEADLKDLKSWLCYSWRKKATAVTLAVFHGKVDLWSATTKELNDVGDAYRIEYKNQ